MLVFLEISQLIKIIIQEELNKLQSKLLAEQEQKLEKQKQTLLEEAKQSKKNAINDIANKLLKKFQHEFELQSQKHIRDVAQAIRYHILNFIPLWEFC